MEEKSNTTLRPFLTVKNGKAAVAFYIAAFGATEISRFERPDEGLHSLLRIEGADFWVGDEEPQFGNISPEPHSNSSIRMILETQNADVLFENAIKLGATQICPMTTEDDWRIGKLRDPFGHIWEIGYTL
jgi:PhnB protein